MTKDEELKLIKSSLRFVSTITSILGDEAGMAAWDKIAEVIEPSLKGKIFFAMVTGEYEECYGLKQGQHELNPANKIQIIKTLRAATGMSLRDAKDAADTLYNNSAVKIFIKKDSKFYIKLFEGHGLEVF